MNDADYEIAALARAGDSIAHGVCPHCDEALDPIAYEAAHPGSYSERYTAEDAARSLGPVEPGQPYHAACWAEIMAARP